MWIVVQVVLSLLVGGCCALVVVLLRGLDGYGVVILPGVDPLVGFGFGLGLAVVASVVGWLLSRKSFWLKG